MGCRRPIGNEQAPDTPTRVGRQHTNSKGHLTVTYNTVLACDPNDLILLVGKKIRISEYSRATFDPILELVPLPRFSREGIDVQDMVFPLRLFRPIQYEVVGVGKREVWDRRE